MDEKIGVAEIVNLLKRYQKRDLELRDSIEREMPNVESIRKIRDMTLVALENAINSYIDDRIKKFLDNNASHE